MDFFHRMDIGLVSAALVLPAWLVFRLPWYYLSVPVGTLVFGGLLVVSSFLLREVAPVCDGFTAVLILLFGWMEGFAYCFLWAAVRKFISRRRKNVPRRSRSERAERMHLITGLVIWWSLWAFCVVLPFAHRPAIRRSDPTFFADYFGVCSPILLVVMTMSLMYLVQLLKRAPAVREASACDLCNDESEEKD